MVETYIRPTCTMVLIIGNQNYNDGNAQLETPINDAHAIYKIFTDLLKIDPENICLLIDNTKE